MTAGKPRPPAPLASRWAALSHWLPVLVWLTVMLVMTSLPDPDRVLGPGLRVRDPTAHTMGYFVLMLLSARLAVFLAGEFRPRVVLYALAACLIYAVIDELHQIPVPGRWFAWADLLSDALGAIGGMVVAVVVGWWRAGIAAD